MVGQELYQKKNSAPPVLFQSVVGTEKGTHWQFFMFMCGRSVNCLRKILSGDLMQSHFPLCRISAFSL